MGIHSSTFVAFLLQGEVDAVDAVLRAALLGGVAVSVLRLAVRSAETPGRRPADVEADDEASRQVRASNTLWLFHQRGN